MRIRLGLGVRSIDDWFQEAIDLGEGTTAAAYRRRQEIAEYERRTSADLDSMVMPDSEVVSHARPLRN